MTHVLTLVAPPGALTAGLVARARDAFDAGAPVWLADAEAADLALPAAPDRTAIAALLGDAQVDWHLGPAEGRRKKLLVADMDSTIVTSETLDEIAAFAGLKDRIAEITRRSMNGEVDFAEALRLRVGMLKGLGLDALARTWAATEMMPGAAELVATMNANGAVTALVSGGFTYFTGRVAERLGFTVHRSNELLHDGAALTGKVAEPILDRDAKLATLRELAAAKGWTETDALAVGDGANDLAMIGAAGLGVAYRAKPIVAAEARTRVDHADLRALLFFQGYPAKAFVAGG